jgi:uncharacterized YccA/Bax inhibitor family protein
MQTSNPVLSNKTFSGYGYVSESDTMTMNGVVLKTAILLLITLLSAGWMWVQFVKSGNPAAMTPWMIGGAIGGLVLALATTFKPAWSAVTAPLYALVEGLFIGGLSSMMEAAFPGIVIQATLLTFGTLFAMLGAYTSGLIRATEKFKLGVVAATGGIMIVYLITFALSFFGIQAPFMHGGGWMSIAFSLFVIGVAALNFILDFDLIEQGARRGAPKYMEWYAGFALMVTLIWLYVEFLRLLSNLKGRE